MTKVQIYSDGGARGNPGPAAIGVLICDVHGKALQEYNEVIGATTNNVAEYRAVIKGLELAKEIGVSDVDYYVDSQLVAFQLSGKYRIKTPHIRDLYLQVKKREADFKHIRFTQVPRTHEKIKHVDKLVNLALDEAGH